jgi:hypothetical protein
MRQVSRNFPSIAPRFVHASIDHVSDGGISRISIEGTRNDPPSTSWVTILRDIESLAINNSAGYYSREIRSERESKIENGSQFRS